MHEINCVLFDLDGVLVDACEWHFQSLNEAMMKIVGYQISREDHEKKYNGLPTKVKLSSMGIEANIAAAINDLKQENTVRLIVENVRFDSQKVDLLNHLKENKVLIGCVTNSIRKNTELMLEKSGILSFFDVIVANEDVKNNKPFPDCYNLAMEKLSSNPDRTLCVEDSPKGILAAKSSFAKYVWQVENANQVTLERYKRLWL